jgi:hypothetical protein
MNGVINSYYSYPLRKFSNVLTKVLGNEELDALFLNVFIFLPLHVSSSKCSSSGGPNCINTSSGITHSGECGPPDDEHLLLETCRGINKYIKKECIKLVITQNRIKMHGQQNIKFVIKYSITDLKLVTEI